MSPAARPTGPHIRFPTVLNALTSLRYLAAIWVVFFHFRAFFPDAALGQVPLIAQGSMGVDFFFVLSGFVLAHVYLGQFDRQRFDYWGFIVRRFARIYPLHGLTLAASLALGVIAARQHWAWSVWNLDEWLHLPHGLLQRIVFGQVVLIHAWGGADGLHLNMPSWSISAEWFAYLTFPLTVAAMGRGRARLVIALAVVAAAMIAMDLATARWTGHSLLTSTWNIGVFRIMPEFALGVGLRALGDHISFGGRGRALAVFWGATGGVLTLVEVGASPSFVVLALALLIFAAADAERHGAMKLLGHPFPVLLGEVSYAVYMFHFLFGVVFFDRIVGMQRSSSSLVAAGWIMVALVLITLLSWHSHRFFEAPTRTFLIARARRLSPRLEAK